MAKKQSTVSAETPQATPETPQVVPDVPQVAPENTEKVTVASTIGLNLRCGPARSYASLKLLPDGAELSIHELPGKTEVPGWALVETSEGLFGWVCADFLQAASES